MEFCKTGHLRVKDGNEIYWELSGHPDGKPVVFLHGGPGAGITGGYRKHFDPAGYLIVGFEQRGCGRSIPSAAAPGSDLSGNTTPAIISDMEELRCFLGVEKWMLLGVSWGTTLALAYAQAHPERVSEMILAAVTATTDEEVEWITETMGRIFPAQWESFRAAAAAAPGERLIDAYYRLITHPDPAVRARAAEDWCRWEDVHVSLDARATPDPRFQNPEFRDTFATLVIHYWKHAGFAGPDGIFSRMERLHGIPAVLIHGRLDVSSPLSTAWRLHQAWPGSELIVVEDEGHGGPKMAAQVTLAAGRFAA